MNNIILKLSELAKNLCLENASIIAAKPGRVVMRFNCVIKLEQRSFVTISSQNCFHRGDGRWRLAVVTAAWHERRHRVCGTAKRRVLPLIETTAAGVRHIVHVYRSINCNSTTPLCIKNAVLFTASLVIKPVNVASVPLLQLWNSSTFYLSG